MTIKTSVTRAALLATFMSVASLAMAGEDTATLQSLQHEWAKANYQLPEDQREVFLLREEADLSFKEIADIVGISENTVKSRMRYALEKRHMHSCRDSFLLALARHDQGMTKRDLPSNVNFFMNVPVR